MVWDKPQDAPLNDLDKRIIGPLWCVLEIPLEDRVLLKKVGDMLSGLGRDISMNAGREISRRELALIVKHRVMEVNQRTKNHASEAGINVPRAGRRRRRLAEQARNEEGTTTVTNFAKPLHRVYRQRS